VVTGLYQKRCCGQLPGSDIRLVLSNNATLNSSEWPWRSLPYCKPLQMRFLVYSCAAGDRQRRAVPLRQLSPW